MGGVDLQRDLNAGNGNLQTLYVRSHLVLASRAAGIGPPIDSVYPHLNDPTGLREQAQFARSLGFFGKSAIHPRQLDVLHDVFSPSDDELSWAREVLAASDAAAGEALCLPSGEFVDLASRRSRAAATGTGSSHTLEHGSGRLNTLGAGVGQRVPRTSRTDVATRPCRRSPCFGRLRRRGAELTQVASDCSRRWQRQRSG